MSRKSRVTPRAGHSTNSQLLHQQGLTLNANKTCYLHIRKPTVPADRHLTISGVNVVASKHVPYLGVEIDEHLTFKPLLASRRRKKRVYRIRSHLTPRAKCTFYLSFIQSTLEYASSAYVHTLHAAEFEALLKLSKRAFRVVFGYPLPLLFALPPRLITFVQNYIDG